MKEIGKIVSLQIAMPTDEIFSGKHLITAVNKTKVNSLKVMKERIDGNDVGNKQFHGGPDRAICFYPYENYKKWEQQMGIELRLPAFGENITVSGMKEESVYIGDIYRIGDCTIQITQGRIPCATISVFNAQPSLLKNVMETSLTGYFARVLKPGTIKENDEIILEQRVQENVSVPYASRVVLHGLDALEGIDRLLSIPAMSEEWKRIIVKKREKITNHLK